MQVSIPFGQSQVTLEIAEKNWVPLQRQEQPLSLPDPAQAVREALESPYQFPPLRRALTPQDHVVVLIDEELPRVAQLLIPILDHILQAQIPAEAITLLCLPPSTGQPWLEELPEQFEEVHVEIHDPHNRKKMAYLATTKKGRRIYLNRSAVDADQLVVLTRRGYDSWLGYSGAETAIFPALCHDATLKEMQWPLSLKLPGEVPWPIQQEAAEVAWLLGAPFFVQVIDGMGSDVAHVLAGVLESSVEGQRLLNSDWRVVVDSRADVVIASISGDPAQNGFTQLGRALVNAARVVKPGGRIVLLTESDPKLGQGGALLREAGESRLALQRLQKESFPERQATFHWASAAEHATVYLLSKLAGDVAEELFTVPLENAGQVQRLIGTDKSCLVLPDAHKMLVVLRE